MTAWGLLKNKHLLEPMQGKFQITTEQIQKKHLKIIIIGFEKIRITVLHITLKTLQWMNNIKVLTKTSYANYKANVFVHVRKNKEHAINSFTMQRKQMGSKLNIIGIQENV